MCAATGDASERRWGSYALVRCVAPGSERLGVPERERMGGAARPGVRAPERVCAETGPPGSAVIHLFTDAAAAQGQN